MKRVLAVVFVAVFTFIGCGEPRDKVPVSGTVTWNGEPIADGYISFFSAPQVPAGAGPLKAGKFDFLCKPAKVSVEIVATREGKYDAREKAVTREQFVPAKYNARTVLSADVTASGKNQFAFPLTGE